MNTSTNGRPNLVLLIDSDPATRQSVVPLLVRSGMELVQRLATAWPGLRFSSVYRSAFVSRSSVWRCLGSQGRC